MCDKGDCSVTASDPRELWRTFLEDSSLWTTEGCQWPDPSWLRAGQRPLENSSGCCGPAVEERGWSAEPVERSRAAENAWALSCFERGLEAEFFQFCSPSQWRYIPVCGVSCSIEKSEMLLPDKPFCTCWKPVQREQRRLLFFSQWVKPRERREAPAGCRLESLLEKESKAQKNKKITGCSLNKMAW